ncbi:Uncharacterised protein [Legionella busanensis]|uniref:Uncharacterized protein n=1 Tax=Legionella busanensis TaxID=190655 RepID=A0A378JQ17_9GAMM|nr:hypothetical protein [Legionella busanensis]STX52363.1 Uncharacterised protein [Legionella busanensis]
MQIPLSDDDKELIRLIDIQVEQLIEKQTPDHLIITTLFDFIPNVKCLVNATGEKKLQSYCSEYQHFNYFLQLIS